MRKLTGICLLLLLAVWVGPAFGQSLGAIAKKERERREKNKSEGVPVQEFTEEEVFGPDEEEGEDTAGDFESEPEEEMRPEAGTSAPSSADLERESRERRRSEAEWRMRVQNARARIEAARERRRALDGLNLSVGEYYVDARGRTVIQSLEHLQRLVREADEELAEAEAALDDLLEEARRAGVPPGWLR